MSNLLWALKPKEGPEVKKYNCAQSIQEKLSPMTFLPLLLALSFSAVPVCSKDGLEAVKAASGLSRLGAFPTSSAGPTRLALGDKNKDAVTVRCEPEVTENQRLGPEGTFYPVLEIKMDALRSERASWIATGDFKSARYMASFSVYLAEPCSGRGCEGNPDEYEAETRVVLRRLSSGKVVGIGRRREFGTNKSLPVISAEAYNTEVAQAILDSGKSPESQLLNWGDENGWQLVPNGTVSVVELRCEFVKR
ncbi:MAG: hypothetical protein HY921_11320 [Elusimicrobia bacterium]|nr:hypothetical protein [Elusimicrobiota bacterium]